MKRHAFLISLFLGIFLGTSAFGLELIGVTLPDTTQVSGKTLDLVGAGVRTKTIFKVKVYVAGLYMENPSKDPELIISADQAKSIVMHFVYKEVGREKLVDGWNEGFEKNSAKFLSSLEDRIDRFNSYFDGSVKKGEEIVLTYVPGKGTEVSIKGKTKGTVEGKDFMEALFKIWFGEHPADSGLKESILQ